jgi:hypothetical protein
MREKSKDSRKIDPLDEFFKLLKRNENIKVFLEKPLDRRSFTIISIAVVGVIFIWMLISSMT